MVQARVPADGTWSNAIMGANQEVLAVDFGANKAICNLPSMNKNDGKGRVIRLL